MPTDYEILGIAADCTDAEVRAAYLAAIRRSHPDVDASSASDVAAIVTAYRNLRSADRRAIYDRRIATLGLQHLLEGRAAAPALAAPVGDRWRPLALLVIVGAILLAIGVAQALRRDPAAVPSARTQATGGDGPIATSQAAQALAARRQSEAALDAHWISTLHGLGALKLYSTECYVDAHLAGSRQQCSQCGLLDKAAADMTPGDSYFSTAAIAERNTRYCR